MAVGSIMQVQGLRNQVRGKPGMAGFTLGQWATRVARSAGKSRQQAGLGGSCS